MPWRERKVTPPPITIPRNRVVTKYCTQYRIILGMTSMREVLLPDHDGSILDDVADAPECKGIAVFRNDVFDTHHTLSIS